MTRRLKSAVELVSDIGCKAFDLQHHSELEIRKAVALLRTVNAPMFDWLTQMLQAPVAKDSAGCEPDSHPVSERVETIKGIDL